MGRKSTQTLLNTLFVSDIRIDLMKNCKLRAVTGRDMQPCLPHETEKSDCLQGNGLTTGIWTGHDQQIKLFSESDRDRNDRLRIQQRVTSLTDMDFIFFVKNRTAGFHGQSQCTSCKNKVEIGQSTVIRPDFFNILGGFFTQTGKNDLDFFLFSGIKFLQVIIQFHDSHRFNKKRRTGRRLVMDQSLNLSTVFSLDRDAVAVTPHGDDRIL